MEVKRIGGRIMFHFLGNRSLLHFNNFKAPRIEALQNPFRELHSQTDSPSTLIEYLQDSLGFSPGRALKISERLRQKVKNPDLVPAFLRSHGFSKTQIKSIINQYPSLFYYASPELILAKIQFFREKGFAESDVVKIVVTNPIVLAQSLERNIKPLFDFIHSFLGRDEFVVELLCRPLFVCSADRWVSNASILRGCGMKDHCIAKLMRRQPRVFATKPDRFSEIVEMTQEMGFKPLLNTFIEAVITITGLSRLSWDMKFKIYRSLGWSDEEILSAFRKLPTFMRLSEEKIKKGMDFYTRELGWDPSYISRYPKLLCLSLEKRTIPRHRILQFLALKGLVKKNKMCARKFTMSEREFLDEYVRRYQSEAPDTSKFYEVLVGSKGLNI